MTAPLVAAIAEGLDRPVPDAARAIAGAIGERLGGQVAAILFYGSCLRSGTTDGILDFYVVVDPDRATPDERSGAAAVGLIQPRISFWSVEHDGRTVRAKVATMTRRRFARGMRRGSLDTTLWARFCQPAALLAARDDEARAWVAATLAEAARTAVHWMTLLTPPEADPRARWVALFARTYGAELRAERPDRPDALVGWAPARYERLDALVRAEGRIDPRPGSRERFRARAAWRRRRIWGKALNVARLVNAARTVGEGVDYLVWKLERHAGAPVRLTAWQRRHPVLAAPVVLWRLWRGGVVR